MTDSILIRRFVVACFAVAMSWLHDAAEAADLKIGWIDVEYETREDPGAEIRMIEEATGVGIEAEVHSVPPGRPDQLMLAVRRLVASGSDLVFGLTQSQIRVLESSGVLRPISREETGASELEAFNLLPYGATRTRSGSMPPVAYTGLPFNLSLPVICYNREEFSYLAEYSPSVLEISFGKIAQRVSMADPRFDPVGRSVLLSLFLDAKGIHGGLEYVESLDRLVDHYVRDHVSSCEEVANGEADIAFTELRSSRAMKGRWPHVGFQSLNSALFVPVNYVAALPDGRGRREALERVFRWLLGKRLFGEIDALASEAEETGLRVEVGYIAEQSYALNYFPIGQIIEEWSARYDFKSIRSSRF